ncbi:MULTISPECIES: hypothetical protein [unclassified Mesorhizobium]|nr:MULTISPECIES: hypothetical protein [unclassified Mesorhizobium]
MVRTVITFSLELGQAARKVSMSGLGCGPLAAAGWCRGNLDQRIPL